MPNRIIKESICTSENLDKLSAEAEVFFYRLMVVCDDYGIMFAAPSILRSKCYPWKIDKIKDKDIEKWRGELLNANLIFMYEYDGKLYLKMTKWEDHQQIRATKSKYPTPAMDGVNMLSNDVNGNQLQANVPVIERSNRIRDKREVIEIYTSCMELRTAIKDYMDMRVKIKKPMTDKAVSMLLKKLDGLASEDDDKIKILEEAVLHNWQSVYPLKGDNSGQAKTTGNTARDKGEGRENPQRSKYAIDLENYTD